MISVKCPACGLVDWNVGNCKRCETPLAGLGAEVDGEGYSPGVSEWAAEARGVRTARRVMAVCAFVVLGLTALGALHLAHKPSKRQWFWSFYRHEPSVAEIFAHNLEVSGGARRISKLRSFRAEGRLTFDGGEATFVMHVKAPDKVETEVEMGPPTSTDTRFEVPRPSPSSYFEPAAPQVSVSLRRGFDGSKGWEYVERTTLTDGSTVPAEQHSSRELGGEELWRMRRYTQATGLARLADEYTSLKLDGREPVTRAAGGGMTAAGQESSDAALRGHEAYVVSGLNREGKGETFYFDTETGLLLRVTYEAEDEEGEPVRVECAFGDYREVGGLRLPHRLHFKRGEESMTMTFEQYFPNDPIPDSTFAPPEPP